MRAGHRDVRSALVVGLGSSGTAVCELLRKRGVQVLATDSKPREAFGDDVRRIETMGCRLRLGRHVPEDFLGVDQIIVSPGVPLQLEGLKLARKAGVEVVGELEWAWRQVQVPVVAVTGTNGKTTTTALIGHLLAATGRRVFVGGNIGTPLSRWLLWREETSGEQEYPQEEKRFADPEAEVLVLEVSSFQLDGATRFSPQVGVLLNVSEDHLDRYEDFRAYAASKRSMFIRQGAGDVAVVNRDDPVCRTLAEGLPGRIWTFSRTDNRADAFYADGTIFLQVPQRLEARLDVAGCPLRGAHNRDNMLAAVLAMTALEVDPAACERGLKSFEGLPHRMQWVGEWKGVQFYNDSKGTNEGAVVSALASLQGKTILLVGGRDKGGHYELLRTEVPRWTKAVIAFGEAGPRLARALGSRERVPVCRDLEEAFHQAVAKAQPGDHVLLSPACASFDQYRNYQERGHHFQRLVQRLMNE